MKEFMFMFWLVTAKKKSGTNLSEAQFTRLSLSLKLSLVNIRRLLILLRRRNPLKT
jgi:hypothetical protein